MTITLTILVVIMGFALFFLDQACDKEIKSLQRQINDRNNQIKGNQSANDKRYDSLKNEVNLLTKRVWDLENPPMILISNTTTKLPTKPTKVAKKK